MKCRVGRRFFREQFFLLPLQYGKEYACLRANIGFSEGVRSGILELMVGDNYFCDRAFYATDMAFATLKEEKGVFGNRIVFSSEMYGKDIQLRMWESSSVTDLEIFQNDVKQSVHEYDLVFPSCPDVDYVGNPCNENGGTCDNCQGDCDYDSDCDGDLRCVQRYYSEHQVPGCLWPNGSNSIRKDNDDFCK